MIATTLGLAGQTFTQLTADLNNLYGPCCEVEHSHKLAANDDELWKTAESLANKIWKAKGMPENISKKMVKQFAAEFWQGVTEGYGKDIIGIDYDTPDARMLANLEMNVYGFSAAKNWQQMKSLTQALVTPSGDGGSKLRTYSEFKRASFEINDAHVNHWLKAEYDTAIAGAQMAGKWVEIQANKGTLTMLEFDAVMDQRTSDLCRGFNGLVFPVDHPFWKQYYPPNHFRCRSTVRQRAGGKASDYSKVAIPEGIPEMFKVNLGEQGLIFPPNHNYYTGLPPEVIREGEALIPGKE